MYPFGSSSDKEFSDDNLFYTIDDEQTQPFLITSDQPQADSDELKQSSTNTPNQSNIDTNSKTLDNIIPEIHSQNTDSLASSNALNAHSMTTANAFNAHSMTTANALNAHSMTTANALNAHSMTTSNALNAHSMTTSNALNAHSMTTANALNAHSMTTSNALKAHSMTTSNAFIAYSNVESKHPEVKKLMKNKYFKVPFKNCLIYEGFNHPTVKFMNEVGNNYNKLFSENIKLGLFPKYKRNQKRNQGIQIWFFEEMLFEHPHEIIKWLNTYDDFHINLKEFIQRREVYIQNNHRFF